MLVICNGAPKSGTTWLHIILNKYLLKDFGRPPIEYANPNWSDKNPYSINPIKFEEFIRLVDIKNLNFYSKNHIFKKSCRDLLLSNPNVSIINIKRDVRDTVVSAYYHYKKLENFDYNFDYFFWSRGQKIVYKTLLYQSVWKVNSPNNHGLSYESLKMDFCYEVEKIARFLRIPVTCEYIKKIEEDTHIEKLKKAKWNEKAGRFRKGKIGDWKNHLNALMELDIKIIQKIEKNISKSLSMRIWEKYL